MSEIYEYKPTFSHTSQTFFKVDAIAVFLNIPGVVVSSLMTAFINPTLTVLYIYKSGVEVQDVFSQICFLHVTPGSKPKTEMSK